jgi:hypothetical protein
MLVLPSVGNKKYSDYIISTAMMFIPQCMKIHLVALCKLLEKTSQMDKNTDIRTSEAYLLLQKRKIG